MYWLRWHYHVKDSAGAPYKIKKAKQTKRQNRRQPVVAGRQQLYCAVQSRSPSHCQTTTGKVQSSVRDGTSSATVRSWQTMAGCSTSTRKARSPSVERLVDGSTSTAESAGCRRRRVSTPDVRCRLSARYAGAVPWRQRQARTHSQNVTRSGTLNQWSSRSNGVMRSDRLAENTKRRRHSRRTARVTEIRSVRRLRDGYTFSEKYKQLSCRREASVCRWNLEMLIWGHSRS